MPSYGIRPESPRSRLPPTPATPARRARHDHREPGTEFLVSVEVAGELFRATIEEGCEPAPGDTVTLLAAPSALLYDATTNARI